LTTGKRSVPEWVGDNPDQAIPARVKIRVLDRFDSICQISMRKISAGEDWDCDHIIAQANGGENRESNLQPALRAAEGHKAKTRADMALKTKIERVRKKHMGVGPKKQVIPGSRASKWKRTVDGRTVLRSG